MSAALRVPVVVPAWVGDELRRRARATGRTVADEAAAALVDGLPALAAEAVADALAADLRSDAEEPGLAARARSENLTTTTRSSPSIPDGPDQGPPGATTS